MALSFLRRRPNEREPALGDRLPPGQYLTEKWPVLHYDDQGPPPPAEVVHLLSRRPTSAVELARIYAALAPHFLRTADPGPFLAALDPELLSPESMIRVFDALATWSSVDRLQQVRCPALVLAGQHDVFCSPPQLVRIARRIPGARHVVFEHSGHFMWLEEPDRFFGLVSDWLAQP